MYLEYKIVEFVTENLLLGWIEREDDYYFKMFDASNTVCKTHVFVPASSQH